MIRSEELRIGNWVNITKSPFKEELGIQQISGTGIMYLSQGGDIECEPIPLTEEILIKSSSSREYFHDGVVIYKFGVFNGYSQNKGIWIAESLGNYGKQYPHINSVHQLQNLFYFLSGKELELQNI